jgi:Rhodanese-related sulfurtransferase
MNKEGYASIDEVLSQGLRGLNPDDFEALANETGAVMLDVRPQSEFVKGFIPKSVFIGLDGGFAPWVGALIRDTAQPILLIAPQGREEEAVTRLARVGFDKVLGFLQGGFSAWQDAEKETDALLSLTPDEVSRRLEEQKVPVIDVRKTGEYQSEHVQDALNLPLDFINDNMQEFPQEQDFYVHCAGGYRSVIAASILKARGYHNVIDIAGGFDAIKKSSLPVTDYVCPSTLKG